MEFYLSVDSLEQIPLDMNDEFFTKISDLLDYLKYFSERNLLTEICGLVGYDEKGKFVFRMMQNRTKDPSLYFAIDPYDYLIFLKKYTMLFIFHTHLCGDEQPSEFDIKTSENCCYPFMIYSLCSEKFSIYEPHFKSYDVNIIKEIRNKI
jgi:proteasome lid subunit RPN8/RPN11